MEAPAAPAPAATADPSTDFTPPAFADIPEGPFGDIVRNDPKRVLLIVIAIVFLIGLMAVPGYMLSR